MDITLIRKAGLPEASMAHSFTSTPAENSWGPRTIPDYEFVYIVKGIARYRDKEHDFKIGVDEMLLIPPKRLHTIACDEIPDTVHIAVHFQYPAAIMGVEPRKFVLKHDAEILPLLRKCTEVTKSYLGGWRTILNCAILEILVHLYRRENKERMNRVPHKIHEAILFMEQNFQKKITRKAVASHLKITPPYLNRLFKKHCGTTPQQYLTEFRMKVAAKLLGTPDLNITEVARKVGFEDPFYFSRVFKENMGRSPRAYARTL